MHRFWVEPEQITEDRAWLAGKEAHHLRKVLRLAVGSAILLLDGTGWVYQARVERISKARVEASVLAKHQEMVSSCPLHLGQAVLKGSKMDLIVQKATELGVAGLQPFVSHYGNVRDASAARLARWQRIMMEACKQCGRAKPMTIGPITSFDQLVAVAGQYSQRFLLSEREESQGLQGYFDGSPGQGAVFFMVGPEGGWHGDEQEKAVAHGFTSVSLGRRILRAETASLATMAIFQFLLGNLEPASGGNSLDQVKG